MPRNVEIKAYAKNLDQVRSIAAKLSGDSAGQELKMRDTFFKVPEGRLKLRFHENRDSQLIFYTRSNQSGPKLSDFHLAATKTPDDLSNVLERALGVRGEVKKTRWLYMVGQTRVHCDRVDGLGDFAELEVLLNDDQTTSDGEKIAHDLMEKLGIKQDDLIAGAYMDLIEAKTNGN